MDSASDLSDGFINAAPHALVVSDERGHILQVNQCAERLLGYGPGEMLGLSIEDLVPREHRAKHVEMREAFGRGREGTIHDSLRQLHAVRKDGSHVAVVIGIAPWRSAAGLRHVAFIVDDEARRASEKAARDEHQAAVEAGELSQAIIRGASLGIILYDAETGQCVSANAAASTITGVSHDALLRQKFREIASWQPSGLLAAANLALQERRTVSSEIEMVSTAGKRLALRCECIAIVLRERPHLVLLMDDRTPQRDLEEQLKVAQKMEAIGQLAGGVAHDFNNLLTVIGTYSSLMLEECQPDDPRKDDLEEIHSAAKRAAGLTRQLLAFGRRQLFDARPLNLNDVVREMEKMLRRVLSAEITLTIVPDEALGAIHADSGQIDQALMNMVVNARDAMPNGGMLTIETANVDVPADSAGVDADCAGTPGTIPMVMLRVSDTGIGMDEATAAKAFDPFFTTKEPGRGTGLGLSTTYGIVKQSGGFIRTRSTPGKGTVFDLYFPRLVVAESEPMSAKAEAGDDARGSGEIVVVEDDEHVRRIVVTALRSRGYDVTEASNGEEALSLVIGRDRPPDLLVTDVIMPRINGRDLVRKLRVRWPELRVLFTTAYAVDEMTDQAAADLPGALLRKPFVPVELARAVREALLHGSG